MVGSEGGRLRPIDSGGEWLVVLLGWLGAEVKHLRRYAELYNVRGASTVRLVVKPKEFLGPDMGRGIEYKMGRFAAQLVQWFDGVLVEGKKPRLLFHTFSNTGWLCYGIILENLQSRSDILEKVRGCVVDSGPAAEIDPKHWAAGFGAALLKMQSSLVVSTIESTTKDKATISMPGLRDMGPPLSEVLFLFLLEKFFSIVLKLPDVNRRLTRIISMLSEKQPSCPQLYLYSSGDRVVPAQSVESFIQKQKALGINAYSHDFVTSPHVDHLRNFPQLYASKVYAFWKECCSKVACDI